MKQGVPILMGLVMGCAAAGCRTATRVTEMPRVDLDLTSSGNRGYLLGTPPPASASERTTRQMVETEVEIPSLYKPKRGQTAPVSLREVAPPEVDLSEEEAATGKGPAAAYDTYVVKKGDTLWSIAASPQIYGDATRWRSVFEANRDLLRSPDRLRPGMTLRIPRGASTTPQPSPEAATSIK